MEGMEMPAMINPGESDIGRAVICRPAYADRRLLRGVITALDREYVFVRYDRDGISRATRRIDLHCGDRWRDARKDVKP